jgi:hypothetical protein
MRDFRNVERLKSGKAPIYWCDFNACGLSGDPKDNCFYRFGPKGDPIDTNPLVGMKVLLYDEDGDDELLTCEATLEFDSGWWRARPNAESWRHLTQNQMEAL